MTKKTGLNTHRIWIRMVFNFFFFFFKKNNILINKNIATLTLAKQTIYMKLITTSYKKNFNEQ